MRIREVAARTLAVLAVWGAFALLPGRAGAQDLFELEVLGDEIAPPGGLVRSRTADAGHTFDPRLSSRTSVVLNPSLEIVTRGSDGLEPVVDVSAQAAWRLAKRVSIATDDFSAAATTRHLQSAIQAHHLLFTGLSVESDSGWEVALSIGHCLLNSEPWLMKSVVGYRF